jgi:hypothetical protein
VSSGEFRPEFLEEKADSGMMVIGDSGDVLGDLSVIEAESTVETVVVGDESFDSDADVDVLSRCWCCA